MTFPILKISKFTTTIELDASTTVIIIMIDHVAPSTRATKFLQICKCIYHTQNQSLLLSSAHAQPKPHRTRAFKILLLV